MELNPGTPAQASLEADHPYFSPHMSAAPDDILVAALSETLSHANQLSST